MGMTVQQLDQFYDFAQRQLSETSHSISMRDLVDAWEESSVDRNQWHDDRDINTLESELAQSELDIQQERCIPAADAIAQVVERLRNNT